MLCSACEMLASAGARRVRTSTYPGTPAQLRALSALTCSACGAVLPESDEGEALLRKLLELSRFGLSAGARPLLDGNRTGG